MAAKTKLNIDQHFLNQIMMNSINVNCLKFDLLLLYIEYVYTVLVQVCRYQQILDVLRDACYNFVYIVILFIS